MGIGLENKNPDDYQTLDFFLNFINADIQLLDERELMALIYDYRNFICPHIYSGAEPELEKKYNQIIQDLLNHTSPEILAQLKEFFYELQKYLIEKMTKIIEPEIYGEHRTENIDIVSSLRGTSTIRVNREENIFDDIFELDGLKPGDELDQSKEEPLAALALANLIRTYNLIPTRFGKCRNCENYYYNKKGRGMKMLNCSVKCANAYRWREYKKSK